MNKINIFLNKNIELILCIFIIIQPIIDVFTSICIHLGFIISLGTIVRFMFMLFMLYYLIFLQKLYRKKYINIILIIIAYMLLYVISNNGIKDIIGLVKAFYFPIIFISIFSVYKNNKRVNDKSILTSLFIYVSIILIASITNTAFDSYDIAKTGSVGWFTSANEIGAIIAILMPFIFDLVFKKFDYFKLLILILTITVSFMIGTRIPLISIGLCLIYYYFKLIGNLYSKKKNKQFILVIIISILSVASFIIFLPKTPIYKNIQIHSEFLKIDSVDDIFKDTKTMDHFIFSSRLSYLKNTKEVYDNSNFYDKLFGIGYTTNEKLVEMDIFDIFYRHGIFGFLIYFGCIIYLICFEKIKKINKEYILPVFMSIFISTFAGHVFISPNVSLVIVVMILNIVFNIFEGCDND